MLIGRLVAGVLADGVLLLRVTLGRARIAPVPVALLLVPIALIGRGLGDVRLVALLTVPAFVVPLRGVGAGSPGTTWLPGGGKPAGIRRAGEALLATVAPAGLEGLVMVPALVVPIAWPRSG